MFTNVNLLPAFSHTVQQVWVILLVSSPRTLLNQSSFNVLNTVHVFILL